MKITLPRKVTMIINNLQLHMRHLLSADVSGIQFLPEGPKIGTLQLLRNRKRLRSCLEER